MNKNNMQSIEFVDLKKQYEEIKEDVGLNIQTVLDHGKFINGPEVSEFEKSLSEFCACKYAVAVSSGTDALLMSLMAENIGPGDAVFLPAFTFTATAEVIVLLGATPVFIDVLEDTYNIDPDNLNSQIESIKNTGKLLPKAVIAVDLFGQTANYTKISEICNENELLLIADAAQSLGASLNGKNVGELAKATAVSFFPAKPLGCYGDGGALLTNNEECASVYRSIRAHGKGNAKYDIVRVGLNARLDTLQAAILLAKMKVFSTELSARRELAKYYDSRLAEVVAIPKSISGAVSAWAQYSILLENRDELVLALKTKGIPTVVYYPLPLHLQPAYSRYGNGSGSLPVSESLCEKIISLPMHPYMDEHTSTYICDSVIDSIK